MFSKALMIAGYVFSCAGVFLISKYIHALSAPEPKETAAFLFILGEFITLSGVGLILFGLSKRRQSSRIK